MKYAKGMNFFHYSLLIGDIAIKKGMNFFHNSLCIGDIAIESLFLRAINCLRFIKVKLFIS